MHIETYKHKHTHTHLLLSYLCTGLSDQFRHFRKYKRVHDIILIYLFLSTAYHNQDCLYKYIIFKSSLKLKAAPERVIGYFQNGGFDWTTPLLFIILLYKFFLDLFQNLCVFYHVSQYKHSLIDVSKL